MFTRIGRFTVRRRRLVLALTVLFVLAAGAGGAGAFGALEDGGFDDPGSESARASDSCRRRSGPTSPRWSSSSRAEGGADVDDPSVAAAGTALTEALAGEPEVAIRHLLLVAGRRSRNCGPPRARRRSWLSTSTATTRRSGTWATVTPAPAALSPSASGVRTLSTPRSRSSSVRTWPGPKAWPSRRRSSCWCSCSAGVVAASLPLAMALVSVTGTLLALFAVAQVTDVSIYSINLTTALGLGLAIDYSLFIVSRFREELAAGRSSDDAVVRAVETAGRTVGFSALIVAASLSALLVFPLYFLRSFAYAGIAVVLSAAAGALLTLPALLAVLGPRINAWSFRRQAAAPGGTGNERGFWHRLAGAVMRRPVLVATGVIVLLLVLGSPFLRVNPGLPSYESLPESNEARQVAEALATQFDGNQSEQFAVVLPGTDAAGADAEVVAAFADRVSAVGGVADVTVGSADAGSWLTVVPSVALVSSEGEDLVHDIRDIDAPFAFGVEGDAADLVDTKAAIYDRLPLALTIIGITTFVLLFAVFGSLLVPVKAIVLDLLSLTATFGAMVWIFQEGHLSGVLDFSATGQLDVAMPILMFCIAFGLSMDYEVFLLSRIKEEHDRTGDNTEAVAAGLASTGRLITAAALVLAITFAAFVTSGMSFMKLMGLGLALAIVMDATIVRALLVPAVMRLAGEANWWAPGPLRRLQRRWGIREATPQETQ